MTMHGCGRAHESHGSSSPDGHTGVKPHDATKSPTMSVNRALEDADRDGTRKSGAQRGRQQTRAGVVLRPLTSFLMMAASARRRYVSFKHTRAVRVDKSEFSGACQNCERALFAFGSKLPATLRTV